MIELGLSRIQKLLQQTPQSWKALHVAGTNGKGSICAYLTAMLRANNITCGKFTSPHLIDRWDCISINETAVPETKFRHFENLVKNRNREGNIGATEFELLTATAFEIFAAERIEVGVVEVGLGGRLDATNALKEKHVAVISKIGLDHQFLLGNTLEEIALQKAGIMRSGVPCVVDASNSSSVLDTIRKHTLELGASLNITSPESSEIVNALRDTLETHQAQNLAVAHEAFRIMFPQYAQSADILVPAIKNLSWPGRLQTINISSLTGRLQPVLLDGAHNPQAAGVLATYVDRHLRRVDSSRVTWVLAASQGKDLSEILKVLIRPGDAVAAVEFGKVDGMPWVKPMKSEEILGAVAQVCTTTLHDARSNLENALAWATEEAEDKPLVIAGSLYLVSDVLRLLKART